MTTGMDDRRDAFEKKFAHDADLRFKAEARRNKLLGLWAAERLGKKDGEAEAYARDVIAADFIEAGDDDVFRKIRTDFDEGGVTDSDETIREKMQLFLEEAIRQIQQD
ncbi:MULTISPECIES: DUF1476 domain-containing protein [Brucella/Ochrobactrum group]|uniref:DUF1476 domain-containing protein n=2 Tax=Ochrobactrum TaxID=528 RepID=A0A2P9HLZ9_9HYPH|nr:MULTISPECIES: DUF1476 domain-containing protein [Brucella]MCI0999688.1 DUF1476 domain-containing protein [Ochrobactrum sp. C6C9]RRD25933.1 DUF1476 domain-containing protein [Brucellaceae bacterium VT-16-1752]WHT42669.1 DUF1476 domain-containing protein [Ochrobactrum sp. SSR]MDX4072362.1 DUF1476 domain-containing protein [Brucella sp. NBRC 113783]NNU60268.1 DUF1476 domain-containing protein [[Ochrobactrum] soli]